MAGDKPFRLVVMTPERKVLDIEVTSLIAPGTEGFLGVLANHAPLITALDPGPLEYRRPDGTEEAVAVAGGFLEVSGNVATILADAVERPEEIDVDRARAAAERARKRLARRNDPAIDVARAEAALKRALNRLRMAEKARI